MKNRSISSKDGSAMQNIAGAVLPVLSERQALRKNMARWLPVIDPALLTRLEKADPETWGRIVRGVPLKPCGQYLTYDNGEIRSVMYKAAYIPFGELLPEVAEAWLQHVLQDAIRANGWQFKLQSVKIDGNPGYESVIWIVRGERRDIGNSPAEAILRAYLAAIEVGTMIDFREAIAVLTPATEDQLADCQTKAEALLVGAMAMRGYQVIMIDEVLRDYRRLEREYANRISEL